MRGETKRGRDEKRERRGGETKRETEVVQAKHAKEARQRTLGVAVPDLGDALKS